MRHLTNLTNFFSLLGLDLYKTYCLFRWGGQFIRDYRRLKQQRKGGTDFLCLKFYPILYDKRVASGIHKGHYFHQDFLVARKIFENNPTKHVDIGSRIDGFVTHVAVFREIEVFDIRPLNTSLYNIQFKKADLMQLPDNLKNYCDSLSSLHVIEHFGLGRYGDPIDYDGHIKALNNFHLILKPAGILYLSVPVGDQRIEFNAHRVFSIKYMLGLLEGKFKLKTFHYVDDEGCLIENAEITPNSIETNFGCHYGCGIFELLKIN